MNPSTITRGLRSGLGPPTHDIGLEIQHDHILGLYQFGEKTARHHFCKKCGIYTFHETARFPGKYRVNLGCLNDVDVFEVWGSSILCLHGLYGTR